MRPCSPNARLAALPLALAVCLIAVPMAEASSVSRSAATGIITFAGDFLNNNMTVTYNAGTNVYTFRDTGVAATVTGTAPCTTTLASQVQTCPGAVSGTPATPRIVVTGDSGNDTIDASTVNSVPFTISDSSGDDTITGSQAGDTITDSTGTTDTTNGAAGNDTIDVGSGNSTVDGGAGNDTITASSGTNTLNGGADNDTITGGTEVDTINGGDGNDPGLNGGGGNDVINGNNGADTLSGGPGDDGLFGNASTGTAANDDGAADKLRGGTGADRFDVSTGGATVSDKGIDRVLYNGEGRSAGVTVTIGDTPANDGDNSNDSGKTDNVGSEIESITGTEGVDLLTGDGGNNTLAGEGAGDTLSGGNGNDFLYGATGNDTLNGGAGSDRATYRTANNMVQTGAVTITENNAFDDTDGLGGTDNFGGVGRDIEYVFGGDGNDTLNLFGYAGGVGGNTPAPNGIVVSGGGGDDTLIGSTGSDYLEGGPGTGDKATCNGGADILVTVEGPNTGC